MLVINVNFNRMMKIIRLGIDKLVELNIFLDVKTLQEQNKKTIRDQVLATRIYVFLFIAILIILMLFNGLATKAISITVLKPSINTYDRLHAAYSNTLQCSCSDVTASYSGFISAKYVQHPVRSLMQPRDFLNLATWNRALSMLFYSSSQCLFSMLNNFTSSQIVKQNQNQRYCEVIPHYSSSEWEKLNHWEQEFSTQLKCTTEFGPTYEKKTKILVNSLSIRRTRFYF